MRTGAVALGCALALSGCAQTIPAEALQLTATSLSDRQLETRRFDIGEHSALTASAQVLQDLGFHIDESETSLGVLVASKDRDAVEAGQVAAAVLVAVMGGGAMPIDDKQKLRASIVTEPVSENSSKVRVTFQRIVWDTQGRISKIEGLKDPNFYQQFFDKLSQSIFLEAHQI